MHLQLKDNNVDELFITKTQAEKELVNRINFTYSSHLVPESDAEFCVKFDFLLTSERGFKFKLVHDFIFGIINGEKLSGTEIIDKLNVLDNQEKEYIIGLIFRLAAYHNKNKD